MKNGFGRLLLRFWLVVLSTGLVIAQNCPNGKTAFVWVNGILVPNQATWATSVAQIRDRFYSSHPNLSPNCIAFDTVYNQTNNAYRDLLQSKYQLGMQDVDKYLNDLNALNTQPKAHQSFMAAALGYQNDVLNTDPDIKILHEVVKTWWSQGYRVVLVGHSQGNLYTNAEYNLRLRNPDSPGKQLPDSNQLSVVGIATPTNNIADGRKKYTTHCNDFIYYSPNTVASTVGNKALPWNVKAGWLSCAAASTANFVLNLFGAAGDLVNLGYAIWFHPMDKYLLEGSNAQKQIYEHLEDSLPDPGCAGDINCYLKDNFSPANSYSNNWLLTKQAGNSNAPTQAGYLSLDSINGVVFGGQLTLRTRRVFTGPLSGSVWFNNIGGGQSSIRLKKVIDDSIVLALNIDSVHNTVAVFPNLLTLNSTASSFGGWRLLTFFKTDTQVTMTVGNFSWGISSDVMSGYYLEVDSGGNNTFQIRDLSLTRSSGKPVAPPSPPPPAPPTLVPTCSASPAIITAGQPTVFTGSSTGGTGTKTGIWGGVVSGSSPTATYTTSASTPAGFGKATYTVTDSGSPKQTVVANCQVQINAPVVSPSFSENFTAPYSSNWIYTATSGNPVVTSSPGVLTIQAPKSGSSALFVSKAAFSATNSEFVFVLNHLKSGATYVGLWDKTNASWLARIGVDTDDVPCLYMTSGQTTKSRCPSAPYLNRQLTLKMKIGSGQIQFYADGNLVETLPFVAPPSYSLVFSVGSVPWKSADNITSFYSVSATSAAGAPPPASTTGTVNISATSSGSAYTWNLPCTLTKPSGTQNLSSVPMSLSSQPAGSYSLSCTAPSGYSISSISPSSPQNLSGGGTVSFGISLVPIVSTGTIKVLATMNGQAYSGSMACGFLNSPSNLTVNAVPFSQSNLPAGTYNLNCAGGPPNSQLQSISPAPSQTLGPGLTITYTAIYIWATVTVYSNPLPVPPSNIYWTWNLGSGSWYSNGTWAVKPVLTVNGANYTFDHPAGYIEAFKQIKSWGATGPLDSLISSWQTVLGNWPPYVVVSSGPSAPTASSYYWNNTPQNNILFSGNISGSGFVSGNSAVYFCVNNTTTCYQHPAVGVSVNSSISLSVYNVKLTTGYWQAKIVTPYGSSMGPPFYVQ